MAGPFKMKGSPMQRNFGISPMKDKPKKTSTGDKAKALAKTLKLHLSPDRKIGDMYNTYTTQKKRLRDKKVNN